jgi:hypothetical protein
MNNLSDDVEYELIKANLKEKMESIEVDHQFSEIVEEELDKYSEELINEKKDEIVEYLNLKLIKEDFDDPYLFWLRNQGSLPRLSHIALRTLCIPATSCEIEREFNFAGLTLTSKRASMLGDNLNDALFIRSNYDFYFK